MAEEAVKQEGEFTLKGKVKPKSRVKNLGKSNDEPVKTPTKR